MKPTCSSITRVSGDHLNRMKIRSVELFRTAFVPGDIPGVTKPSVVFMGRSNVGKSSLINRLLKRRGLARTSSTPGKTLSINYYLVNERFFLVDLPGYGYARAPKLEINRVRSLMDAYFDGSPGINLLVHLIDSRRGFMESDLEILQKILPLDFPILTVLTKSDKVRSSALKRQIQSLRDRFGVKAIPFSIKSETYRMELESIVETSLKERE